MKKIIALFILALMCISFASCGEKAEVPSETENTDIVNEVEEDIEEEDPEEEKSPEELEKEKKEKELEEAAKRAEEELAKLKEDGEPYIPDNASDFIWSDSSYANLIDPPEEGVLRRCYDYDDGFECSIYGQDKDYFKDLVKDVRKKGFKNIIYSGNNEYDFSNDDGQSIRLIYKPHNHVISIYIFDTKE